MTTKSINKKVKVRTQDGVTYKFDRIDVKFESDYIVGYQNNKKGIGPIRISILDIDMIKIHDKTASIIGNVGIGVGVAVVVFGVLFYWFYNNETI